MLGKNAHIHVLAPCTEACPDSGMQLNTYCSEGYNVEESISADLSPLGLDLLSRMAFPVCYI